MEASPSSSNSAIRVQKGLLITVLPCSRPWQIKETSLAKAKDVKVYVLQNIPYLTLVSSPDGVALMKSRALADEAASVISSSVALGLP